MSVCKLCSSKKFNLADALRDVKVAIGQLSRNPTHEGMKARAVAAKGVLELRKVELTAHAATHEVSA